MQNFNLALHDTLQYNSLIVAEKNIFRITASQIRTLAINLLDH